MRYFIVLAFIIIGTTVGFLSYQVWTAGPPLVLAAPTQFAAAAPDGSPLLRGGWTNASKIDLKVPERARAGVDVEVQPAGTPFSDTPTQTAGAPAGKATCASVSCALVQLHLQDGAYHIQVRLHGDEGVSPWIRYRGMIRVDSTPPAAPQVSSSTDPNPHTTYHTGTLAFAWQSNDAGSGIAGYSYRLDTDPKSVPKQELRTGSPDVTLKGIDTGQYYFHVAAKDNAGNWGKSTTFPVKVDVTPPGLAHVRFSAFSFDPQYGSLGVSFAVTKVSHEVRVGIYRQSDNTLTRLYKLTGLKPGQQVSVQWDGKGQLGNFVSPGVYEVYIRAVDAYGHSSVNGWRDFGVDYKRIYVSLDQQKLFAYDGSKLFLTSLVTSGNQALPTPKGTYHILGKFHPFTFHSPWPKSSPYYYAPSLTQYAMLFLEGGYFIHDAPWRSNFGPGSNAAVGKPGDNYTGTHGCVNVPSDVAYRLYQWAGIGTVVQVGK